LNKFDSSRRSGVPIIDRILDAIQARTPGAFDGLVDFGEIACTTRPQIGALGCPAGLADGALVPAIPSVVCEGGYVTSTDSLDRRFIESDLDVYAVVKRPGASSAGWTILLANSEGGNMAINVESGGITGLRRGCGRYHPEWLIEQASPDYLLPPP
jgi:hypothetical protein